MRLVCETRQSGRESLGIRTSLTWANRTKQRGDLRAGLRRSPMQRKSGIYEEKLYEANVWDGLEGFGGFEGIRGRRGWGLEVGEMGKEKT